MNPPWLVLPLQQPITPWDSCISSLLRARPTDACLSAPADRWILQVTSQHREACWDTWLFFCASRLPKFAFITHQAGHGEGLREEEGSAVWRRGGLWELYGGARALRGWKNNSVGYWAQGYSSSRRWVGRRKRVCLIPKPRYGCNILNILITPLPKIPHFRQILRRNCMYPLQRKQTQNAHRVKGGWTRWWRKWEKCWI